MGKGGGSADSCEIANEGRPLATAERPLARVPATWNIALSNAADSSDDVIFIVNTTLVRGR